MSDIDFEEQLELERLEREKKEKASSKNRPTEKVDPDGTVYEWDAERKAWFPKIDTDFLAKYQMNYGSTEQNSDGGTTSEQAFYENYYQAQMKHEHLLNRKKAETEGEETHDETVQRLETLETRMQEQTDQPWSSEADSKEDMEKYTEEQKKQYNEYWSYYYGTDYHDYYADCMAQYDNTGDNNTENKNSEDDTKDGKKASGKKRKPQKEQRDEAGWFSVSEEHNTNVYVSGLPLDINEEEFKELMNKYGLIMNDPRTRKPKLKIYVDENGQPKGDGRCCFIKKESVDLVLNLLDGSDYRGHKVKVERAQFNMKGDYDPTKKKKKLSNKEKRKLKEKQAKLFDWRPDKPRGARARNEKVVVLKNVFDPKTFEEDPLKINITRDAVKLECAKYGEVRKVIVYDCHQDGVVTVHFTEAEEADMCIEYMNQRYFATRRILAATWDGSAKYEVVETEAQREQRLKKWENFLETGEEGQSTAGVSDKPTAGVSDKPTDGGGSTGTKQSAVTVDTPGTTEPTAGVSDTTQTVDADNSDNTESVTDVTVSSEQRMDTADISTDIDDSSVNTEQNPVDAT